MARRGRLRSRLGRVVATVVLLGVAHAGWRWGAVGFPRLEATLAGAEGPAATVQIAPTRELATEAMARLEELRSGHGPEALSLGSTELSSVLRYGITAALPPGVSDPMAEMGGGRLTLDAKVAVETLPDLPPLGQLMALLPDTVAVQIQGTLSSLGGGRSALHIEAARAGVIPLPGLAIPEVLRALGRQDVEGLPANAVLIQLPKGLRTAYVRGDSLVVVAER